MSRKSVIQLVPAPTGCGDASDLRYRLLMAALGSSDEVNPLLVRPDAPPDDADEADAVAEFALLPANQNLPSAEPRAVERSDGAEPGSQPPPLSLVRPQTPSPAPMRTTATREAPGPAGAAPLPRPPKRR
jgi:hypothetical protein